MQAEMLRGTKEETCEACGAPMILVRHARTQNVMPLNKATVEEGQRFVIEELPDGRAFAHKAEPDQAGHESHFATCPEAKRFRRR